MSFVFYFIFILIFSVEINAMNLLEKKTLNPVNFSNSWEVITDKVMGGVSEGSLELKNENQKKFLRLKGTVSTKNNGGFIQFRSKFNFDKGYSGIRIVARGKNDGYFVHVRTNSLIFPWQYYSREFDVHEDWQVFKIFFEDFNKSNFYQPLNFDSGDIKSIGFVAFGKNFEAELDILELEIF